MTNPFAPLVFDPAAANRAGRSLREVPEAERPRERLAQRPYLGLLVAPFVPSGFELGHFTSPVVPSGFSVFSRGTTAR